MPEKITTMLSDGSYEFVNKDWLNDENLMKKFANYVGYLETIAAQKYSDLCLEQNNRMLDLIVAKYNNRFKLPYII